MSKGGRGPLGMKVFGWHPVRLCSNYTRDELHALARAIMQDPTNRNPGHLSGESIFIYSEKARRKLGAVGWALYYHECRRRHEEEGGCRSA